MIFIAYYGTCTLDASSSGELNGLLHHFHPRGIATLLVSIAKFWISDVFQAVVRLGGFKPEYGIHFIDSQAL